MPEKFDIGNIYANAINFTGRLPEFAERTFSRCGFANVTRYAVGRHMGQYALMAGGFAADHDASSKLECRFVFSPHANIIAVAVVFAVFGFSSG